MKILSEQELVDELRNKCNSIKERLWVSSPYLGENKPMFQIIGDKWRTDENVDFKLLVDYSNCNNCNYDTLKYLFNLDKKKFRIKSLTALHAKIYIFDKECLVTSANLTPTAFKCRYEIGIFLDEDESKEVINIFRNYWKLAKSISIQDLKKSKRSKPIIINGNEFNKGFKSRNKLPEFKNENPQGWLKLHGYSKIKESESEGEFEITKNSDHQNNSFFGTPRGSSLKENDSVILLKMTSKEGKKVRVIYGRAKVDIPNNKNLNLKNYVKKIKKGVRFKERERVIKSINHWTQGFWIKELELILGGTDNFVDFYKLKDSKGKQLIENTSISKKSHIKLDNNKLKIINDELDKLLPKNGKKYNPHGIWLNKYLSKENEIKKKNFRTKDNTS